MSTKKQYRKGVDVKITKNFSSREFDCQCKNPECQYTLIDIDHVEALQRMRDKWGKVITINSAFRCEKHNKAVGGSTQSRHLKGDATDIVVKGLSLDIVARDCEHFNGLGRYNTFVHIDSRDLLDGKKKRWDFRK